MAAMMKVLVAADEVQLVVMPVLGRRRTMLTRMASNMQRPGQSSPKYGIGGAFCPWLVCDTLIGRRLMHVMY
jgi:hypothetical protein